MKKEFDTWNIVKKKIDEKIIDKEFFFHEREVWWCSLGLNIGVEADGKNDNFERPVLIIKKFNAHMIWVLPLTGKAHDYKYHRKITHLGNKSWVSMSQIRTISTKRLLRKVSMIDELDFDEVLESVIGYLKTKPHQIGGESRSPKALMR